MAWTTPRTWTVSQLVTAAELNVDIRDNMLAVVPVGVVLPFAGSAAPTSLYLLCDGSAVSRADYADLFALISTTYGAGNGTTTFNIPDMRGRVPAGYAASGGHTDVATLGNNDGTAVANRRPKHFHQWTEGNGNSLGGTLGNFPSFDTAGTAVNTTTTGGTQDAPSYLVLNYIIKALQS